MEENYKRVPFDIELAKKIQSGEVEGRIVTNNDSDVTILCFNRKSVSSAPIVALIHYNSYDDHVHTYSETGYISDIEERALDLYIELPEETPKHEFKVGDKVAFAGIMGYLVKIDKNLVDIDTVICGIFHNVNISEIEFIDNSSTDKPKHEFKPFDKVLVRGNKEDMWEPRLFGRQLESGKYYCQDDIIYDECVLFDGNEHLVGTTNNPK